MNLVHIHKKIDSDTLYLPELRPFLGKSVKIVVQEEVSPSSANASDPSSKRPLTRPAPGLGKGSILYIAPDFDETPDEFAEYTG